MEIDKVAEFIFVENKLKKQIQLELEGAETPKDLFLFLCDLLFKGCTILYGEEDGSININNINFEIIKQKLKLANIDVLLSIQSNSTQQYGINSAEIYDYTENKPIHEYILKLAVTDYIYSISFKIQ